MVKHFGCELELAHPHPSPFGDVKAIQAPNADGLLHYASPDVPDDVRHLLDPDDVPVSMNIARIQSHPSDVDALHDIGAFCVYPVSDADENDTPDDDANEGGCSPSDDQQVDSPATSSNSNADDPDAISSHDDQVKDNESNAVDSSSINSSKCPIRSVMCSRKDPK